MGEVQQCGCENILSNPFCLSFGLKAQEQRIGKLYNLENMDSFVHKIIQKELGGIKLRSGNPFVLKEQCLKELYLDLCTQNLRLRPGASESDDFRVR